MASAFRYDMRFVKSFSRYDQTKLGCGALLGCLFISLNFLAVVNPDLGPRPFLSLQLSIGSGLNMVKVDTIISSQQPAPEGVKSILGNKPIFNISDPSEAAEIVKKIQESKTISQTSNPSEAADQFEKKIQESKPIADTSIPSEASEIEEKIQENKTIFKSSDPSETAEIGRRIKENKSISNISFPSGAAEIEREIQESKVICNISDPRSNICEMNGDVRIHGNSSTIFLFSSSQMGLSQESKTWKIRPYARKRDSTAMANVKELSLKSSTVQEPTHNCSLNHSVPAIVFSIGGYTGNFFHDFTDVLVPLFITSRQFDGDVLFLITNSKFWWVNKYQRILKHLSKYEIIDFDRNERVHCFSKMMVGLRSHNDLTIDPSRSPNGYSMFDFTRFLRSSYSLERETAIRIGDHPGKKPRLLIISRKRTRRFANVREIVAMAKSLGYEVVVAEADFGMDVSKFAHVVNSCDVMIGVHGAGLTNLVFLPTNAVLIQVVPFGGVEWVARTYFAKPAKDMKIRYLEYKIEEKESTLIKQYPHDHAVLRDPISISKQGWAAFKSIYLEKQNVKLDVGRFTGTLLQALELLHK